MSRVPASVRRLATASVIALAVTGVAARAVAAGSPSSSSDSSFTVSLADPAPAPAGPATTEPFPAISVVPLPPGTPISPAPPEGQPQQSMQQTIVLVISGGTMSVLPTSASVVLHRRGEGRFTGQFGPVTVIDARGSLVGWKLTAALASPPPGHGHLTVRPGAAVATTGRPGEATAARPGILTSAGTVIMSAAPNGGGGDFSIGATIELSGGGEHEDSSTINVQLSFAVS